MQRYTPETIVTAEECVSRVQGISSCRITVNEQGEIAEIHVTATTDKSPKLIARDVESCLQAEMQMSVDYKKIGVVVLEGGDDSPQDPPQTTSLDDEVIAEFPIEEYPARVDFRSINLFLSQDSVRAEVELVRGGVDIFGSSKSENLSVSHMRVVGEATLNAIAELLDENIRLWLSDVLKVQLGAETAVALKVNLQQGRETKGLAGCSLYTGNTNQTVVFATLDAVNRVLGVLKSRDSIDYRIGD